MHSEKVPYFILDLLQQVPSVYVRGLGRFEAIFHPAVIDLQASQIKPPYIHADFIPMADTEIDVLPAYMHYVTGIDVSTAKENIASFVDKVLFLTSAGEPYNIEKFGIFSKSSGGILHFTPDWDAFNLSFKGLEVLDLHPSKEMERAELSKTPGSPKIELEDYSIKPAVVDSIASDQSAETVIEEHAIMEPEVDAHEERPISVNPEIHESTTRLAWAILSSALILITVLCAYLAWDIISDRKRINQLTQLYPDTLAITNEFDIPVKMDTIASNISEVPVTPPIENPDTIVKPGITEPTEPPCFIVVGAFSNEANVTKMMDRLQGLGYKSEKIKGGSLTRVAISTSCDKENLQKVLSEARSAINPEAWIY